MVFMEFPTIDNKTYWNTAQNYLEGGVSSSFRINPFTGRPLYVRQADGPYLVGLDGKKYVDFFMGHGACTLGHNRPEIRAAMQEVIDGGFYAEFDNPISVELAMKIVEHVPCAERVRYTTSGSEATLLALRLARGFTGRQKIVRIDGHFHGVHDYALANNLAAKIDRENPGDRLSRITNLTAGIPDVIRDTLYLIPWNRPEVFEQLAHEHGHEIAAIIMNPVDYNNGCITTSAEYLGSIRDICDRHGILLIFDEILSGFRTGLSCAQGYYDVTPDLCTLAKALTNGVPLAAIAGKEHIMQKIMDPVDPVISGGTFSGSLLGCAAGLAAMKIMETPGFFEAWGSRTQNFLNSLQESFDELGFPARIQSLGCTFGIYVGTRDPIREYREFSKLNPALAKVFFTKCVEKGAYFHSDYTVSAVHDDLALQRGAEIIREAAWEAKAEML
jgi:glutamate-1-semialdehyde 2,1-aminomutase